MMIYDAVVISNSYAITQLAGLRKHYFTKTANAKTVQGYKCYG